LFFKGRFYEGENSYLVGSRINFLVFIAGCVDTDEDTKATRAKPVSYSLTAKQLYEDYENNEVNADIKYKGKVVIVSGVIQDIGKDIMDSAYIIFGDDKGFLDDVQCMFTSSSGNSTIAQLSKGQSVSVKREVSGKMGNVLLSKCTLK